MALAIQACMNTREDLMPSKISTCLWFDDKGADAAKLYTSLIPNSRIVTNFGQTQGGAESQCGWLKDKFGISWQIVPRALLKSLSGPDKAGAGRAMDAMMKMKKIDIAAIEAAYGETSSSGGQ